MVKCCAYRCDNASYHKTPGLTFHRFPKDERLRNAWIKNMKLQDWQPRSSRSVLCSKHFENHLIDPSAFRTTLRPGAIPTLFNELPVAPYAMGLQGEGDCDGRGVLDFKTLTRVPHQKDCIDIDMLSDFENDDSLQSDDRNEIKVFCPKCNAEISHTAEGIQEDRIKIIVAKVYHYLEQEYEELKKSFDGLERTPLSKFSQRTALATGVSETTVVEILEEEARRNAEVREDPSPNESRARKRPRQTGTERKQTLVLKEEPNEEPPFGMLFSVNEEPEIYVEMPEVKDEPGVSGANNALADPISIEVKIEPQDEEATSSNDTTIEQSATKSYKRRKTKQYTPAVNAAFAPLSPNAPPASSRRHSNDTPEVQSATKCKRRKTKRNTEALTAGSAPPSPNAPPASPRQQILLLDEGEIKMEQIESDEGFS